jgi:hypothetical protein
MFSDAVKLVEDLEGTISRISSDSERIENSYSNYARRTVIGLIKTMGRDEYYRENNPASALIAFASGLLTPLQNAIINNKIRYVETLFSMVLDNQISLFYSELRQGLNYIINAWDASEQDPNLNWFKFNPQKIKNRARYRVIK